MFRCKYVIFNFILLSFIDTLCASSDSEHATDFPLSDCKDADIDLLLVIQAVPAAGNKIEFPEDDDISFLPKIPLLFLKEGEDELSRLRVALVSKDWYQDFLYLHISFDDHDTIESLKHSLSLLSSKNDHLDPQRTEKQPKIFTEAGGARPNAKKIILMISFFNLFHDYDNAYDNDTLFFRITPKSIFAPESAHLFSPFQNLQTIGVSLCNECHGDWFKFEHPKDSPFVSCYYLMHHPDGEDWLDAQSHCKELEYGAGLVSIETREELEFLDASLYKTIYSDKLQHVSQNKTYINIGIRRKETDLDKRFTWINGNPLIMGHWMSGSPEGGVSRGCGVWAFQNIQQNILNSSLSLENSTVGVQLGHYRKTDSDGWMAIGCGEALGSMSLCEITARRYPRHTSLIGEISPANNESYIRAGNVTEVISYYQRLVSVGAYLTDFRFHRWYESVRGRVPTFDCGQKRYIPYSNVCDYVKHCSDDRDENLCTHKLRCSGQEFRCRSKQCIPLSQRCDFYRDCVDGSDEEHCLGCRGRRCCDGSCLPKHWFHDGEVDCSVCTNDITEDDESPYILTDSRGNETCAFICNTDECIFPSQLNDQTVHCKGPEGPLDETLGKLKASQSCVNKMGQLIWAPRCVYVKDRYNSVLGCRDMSHLLECDVFDCPEGYFKCHRSYCIPLHFVSDSVHDCPMGEDEYAVDQSNCIGNFACWNSEMCIHPDLVCDKQKHCPYGDDELNCNTSCMAGFQCVAGTVTVLDYNTTVPLQSLAFVDTRTKYLDLSGVDLSHVNETHESNFGISLYEIRLSGCRLSDMEIVNTVFLQESMVVHLDLSHNLMTSFILDKDHHHDTFHVFNISHNRYLKTIIFQQTLLYYFRLRVLDVSYTEVSHLDFPGLTYLQHLEHLNLSHTKMTELSMNILPRFLITLNLLGTPIIKFYPDSFKGLNIKSGLYTDNYRLCCPQVRGSGIPAHTCFAPQDAISSCFDLVRVPLQRIFLWTMGVAAFVGNILVIVFRITWDRAVLKRGYGFSVTNLAFSDLIMGIYLLIIASADEKFRNKYVWNDRTWKDGVLCQIAGFLSTFSSETSAFFIFLITVDRYLAIRFPFGQCRFSKVGMTVAATLAWAVGFFLALVPLLPPFSDWDVDRSNGMCLGLPLSRDRSAGWQYSFFVFIILNFVMFIAIALGQYAIYKAMSSGRLSKLTNFTAQVGARRVQDIAVAKKLSLIAITDFLCWFPVGVMGLMAIAGHEISRDAYAWTAVLVLPINSALNPLLYTIPTLLAKWEAFVAEEDKTTSEQSGNVSGSRVNTRLASES